MRSKYVVKEALQEITQELSPSIPRASREAQLLLMHSLDVDELWLITHQTAEISYTEELRALVQRRSQNEPLEYLTKRVSFYSQEFFIDYGALIPRPETELLIDQVLDNVENKEAELCFVEVGVGSGIISIILALRYKNARFIAVDISEEALRVASINIAKFNLQDRIELRLGSLLDCVDEKIDYLVSNPPYIANDAPLEENLSYELQNALFGGDVGDEIIQKLLDEALKRKIRFFSCEMGYDQKDKIQNYLQNKDFTSLTFYKDYSDFDRGFTLKV